jgi:hypothetical protein
MCNLSILQKNSLYYARRFDTYGRYCYWCDFIVSSTRCSTCDFTQKHIYSKLFLPSRVDSGSEILHKSRRRRWGLTGVVLSPNFFSSRSRAESNETCQRGEVGFQGRHVADGTLAASRQPAATCAAFMYVFHVSWVKGRMCCVYVEVVQRGSKGKIYGLLTATSLHDISKSFMYSCMYVCSLREVQWQRSTVNDQQWQWIHCETFSDFLSPQLILFGGEIDLCSETAQQVGALFPEYHCSKLVFVF